MFIFSPSAPPRQLHHQLPPPDSAAVRLAAEDSVPCLRAAATVAGGLVLGQPFAVTFVSLDSLDSYLAADRRYPYSLLAQDSFDPSLQKVGNFH